MRNCCELVGRLVLIGFVKLQGMNHDGQYMIQRHECAVRALMTLYKAVPVFHSSNTLCYVGLVELAHVFVHFWKVVAEIGLRATIRNSGILVGWLDGIRIT